jgi:long-chain acyl-CoA synthetase
MTDAIQRVPGTIAELPFFAAGRFPKADLVARCRAEGPALIAGREFADAVRDTSLGLSALGMTRGERVAILSESRPEWLIADLAVLSAGGVTTPIYPTLPVEDVRFILADSGAALAVVSTAEQLRKALDAAASVPSLRQIIVMDGPSQPDGSPPVRSMGELAARGHQRLVDGWGVAREFQDSIRGIAPRDLATIIYTSGTTGVPRGVMLTHGNLTANIAGVLQRLELGPGDTALSFLPLSHAFERLVAYVYLTTGVSMYFAESIETIARDLLTVRPTVMSGVPRVFEKLHARILERGRSASPVRRRLFEWAIGLAADRGRDMAGASHAARRSVSFRVADHLVFSKIRERLGGRVRYAVSGSAPLRVDLAEFFYGIGVPVLEGYGTTEMAPVISVAPLDAPRLGTVGPPLPNVEVRIAEDGEILARGPNLMRGYYNRPDDTLLAIRHGWLHTGDIGAIDEAGYLRITDRKKDLLVTSGGKKIAPQPIEARLRSHALIAEAVLVGDRRHFAAALLLPNLPALGALLGGDERSARARLQDPDVRGLYQQAIDAVNAELAQFERVRKFALLSAEFTIAAGELTPTMKVKRRIVEEKYRDVIERLYA